MFGDVTNKLMDEIQSEFQKQENIDRLLDPVVHCLTEKIRPYLFYTVGFFVAMFIIIIVMVYLLVSLPTGVQTGLN
jgi:hypothetical protein